MRVAVNAWFWDNPSVGSGQYLKYLIPALVEAEGSLELTLVSPKPFEPPPAAEPNLKTVVAPVPLTAPSGNLAKVWFEQVTFPGMCRKLGVDLAHVPYFGSPFLAPVPVIVTIHDLIPMVLPAYRGDARVRLYTRLVTVAAQRAGLILADSRASKQDILQQLTMRDEQVRVVYLAPAPHYQPTQSGERLAGFRKKYNLPDKFLLYLGGYDTRKNVDALIRAFAQLDPALQTECPLVLVGKLPDRASSLFFEPRALIRQLNLEDKVVTPGWIAEEDLPLLYAAARLFVYPSRYEGFGLPVLEAMACGTPVITSNAASLPELAGSAALQLDPDDVGGLANAIARLCTDETARQTMIRRGFEQVEKFTWQKTAVQTAQAYRQMLRVKPEPDRTV